MTLRPISLYFVLALLAAGSAPAQDTVPSTPTGSLGDAQRALHAAQEDLTRAKRNQASADARASSAKRDLEDAQKAVEEARVNVEKTSQAAEAAKAATAQAQQRYDGARGVIERFYLNQQR